MKDQMVHHPPHYNAYSIEVIEVTRHCSFDIGNAVKYLLRHLHKGTSRQDVEKAQWYLNDHINFREEEKPLVQTEEARQNLTVLADEYSRQDDALPTVVAALLFISVDDAYLAATSVRMALSQLS